MTLQYQTSWNNDAAPGDNQREPCLMQERAHVALINGLYGDVYRASGGTPDPAQDPTGTVDDCSVNDPDSGLGTHADGVLQLGLRRLIDGSAVLLRLCVDRQARWRSRWKQGWLGTAAMGLCQSLGPSEWSHDAARSANPADR